MFRNSIIIMLNIFYAYALWEYMEESGNVLVKPGVLLRALTQLNYSHVRLQCCVLLPIWVISSMWERKV